ncbi:helix-turn-helix domain-containing protein [Microbacterium sp. YY-01]|uniref:helix-turn-helix domain-containing protein n=1 Tax=Microbacterium sp. YY-01 TaxID=3421634 RepID=UPI003D165B85
MGFKDAEWAYNLKLQQTQKAVLVALCHRADDKTHETWVGRKTLASMVGVDPRSITNALGALESMGVIKRSKRRRKNGYRDTDLITINTSWTGPQWNEVQVKEVQVNLDQVNVVPFSGETDAHLRRTTFQATSKEVINQESINDHSHSAHANNDDDDDEHAQRDKQDLDAAFESAWAKWPKRTEKKRSREAFAKAVKKRDIDQLVSDITRFGEAHSLATETRYVPALASWLNGERWDDELPQASLSPAQGRQDRMLALVQRYKAEERTSGRLSPTERAMQTMAAGARVSALSRTEERPQNNLMAIEHMAELGANSQGGFPPGYIPTDDEWHAMIQAVPHTPTARPTTARPQPPPITELNADHCPQHPGYPITNGTCDKCNRTPTNQPKATP